MQLQSTMTPYPTIYNETNGIPNGGISRIVPLAYCYPTFLTIQCITTISLLSIEIIFNECFSSSDDLVVISHNARVNLTLQSMEEIRFSIIYIYIYIIARLKTLT